MLLCAHGTSVTRGTVTRLSDATQSQQSPCGIKKSRRDIAVKRSLSPAKICTGKTKHVCTLKPQYATGIPLCILLSTKDWTPSFSHSYLPQHFHIPPYRGRLFLPRALRLALFWGCENHSGDLERGGLEPATPSVPGGRSLFVKSRPPK